MTTAQTESFGQMVKRLRALRGESLEDVAKRSKVSASYIFRIESGTREPSIGIQLRILQDGFGMSMTELRKYTQDYLDAVLDTHEKREA